jgi:hypothetical protein
MISYSRAMRPRPADSIFIRYSCAAETGVRRRNVANYDRAATDRRLLPDIDLPPDTREPQLRIRQ